jgi:poly(3-hydroxybutyrate) depolymerase
MKRNIFILFIWCLAATSFVAANPDKKTIQVGGFEREYLIYTPKHPQRKKADGIIICLHGFGRTMNDFFGEYNISPIADSLNLYIVAPQALPEQDQRVNILASTISSLTNNSISLHSVWGCGLRISANLLLLGTSLLNEELNKGVDDVGFIDRIVDEVISENLLSEKNVFVLGTSMGGFMAYQYALLKGARLSGLISIAGSMGLEIKGMNNGMKIPVCDFHSISDVVVPYAGSQIQYLSHISLAKPKADVINYWAETNATGKPVSEKIQYYPSTKEITVEKITYPEKDNEVIHYKINGAPHNYFFKKEADDCMDHVEEIARFIKSHFSDNLVYIQNVTAKAPVFYPNPVQDKIYLDTESGIISIFDITGHQLFSQSFTEGQIDLSFLKSGIYIIQIQSDNSVRIKKLIKR